MRDILPLPGENDIGYQLQIFGIDVVLADKQWNKPKWETVWNGLSKTIRGAIARYHRDGISSDKRLEDPPEEPAVAQWPIPDDTESA
jgi:hypothetical protein